MLVFCWLLLCSEGEGRPMTKGPKPLRQGDYRSEYVWEYMDPITWTVWPGTDQPMWETPEQRTFDKRLFTPDIRFYKLIPYNISLLWLQKHNLPPGVTKYDVYLAWAGYRGCMPREDPLPDEQVVMMDYGENEPMVDGYYDPELYDLLEMGGASASGTTPLSQMFLVLAHVLPLLLFM